MDGYSSFLGILTYGNVFSVLLLSSLLGIASWDMLNFISGSESDYWHFASVASKSRHFQVHHFRDDALNDAEPLQ